MFADPGVPPGKVHAYVVVFELQLAMLAAGVNDPFWHMEEGRFNETLGFSLTVTVLVTAVDWHWPPGALVIREIV